MPSNTSSISDRARNGNGAAEGDAQDGMFDKEVDDRALERLLDKRAELNQAKLDAARAYKEKDDQVKARLSEFSLAEGEVARVGKWRVENKVQPGGHRSFDVGRSTRLDIKLFVD